MKKRVLTSLLTVVMAVMLATTANADYSWKRDAETLKLGGAANGIVPHEESMDYYYINIPAKMNVTFTETVYKATLGSSFYLTEGDADCYDSMLDIRGYESKWKYSRANNYMRMSVVKTLKKGEYYCGVGDWKYNLKNVVGKSYRLTISAKLANKPSITKVKKTSNTSALITIKRTSDATGYQIYRKTSGAWKKIKTINNSTSSYKNTGLKHGKTYYYKVRAYKKVNGKTYYSDYSSSKKIKV